eukprot:172133_1
MAQLAQSSAYEYNGYDYTVDRKYGKHFRFTLEFPAKIKTRLGIETNNRLNYGYVSGKTKQERDEKKREMIAKYQLDVHQMIGNYIEHNWTDVITYNKGTMHGFHFYEGEINACQEFHSTNRKDCCYCKTYEKLRSKREDRTCCFCGMWRSHRWYRMSLE